MPLSLFAESGPGAKLRKTRSIASSPPRPLAADQTLAITLETGTTNPHRIWYGSSTFYVGKRSSDGQMVMVNVIDLTDNHMFRKPLLCSDIDDAQAIRCSDEHILRFNEVLQKPRPSREAWLVCEYMQGDWLNNVISRNFVEEYQAAYVAGKICKGLAFLYDQSIILRTVKADGIFLSRSGQIKICDFEHALPANQSAHDCAIVAPHWMPPEVARSNAYSPKVDTWGLGILLIEILDKVPPYFLLEPKAALRLICDCRPPVYEVFPLRPVSSLLASFLRSCLTVDVESRPYVKDLVDHSLFDSSCAPLELLPLLRHKFRPISSTGPRDLTGQVTRESTFAITHGGFSDIWLGSFKISDLVLGQASHAEERPKSHVQECSFESSGHYQLDAVPVAIKVLRCSTSDPERHRKIQRRLNHELSVWNVLRHPNVVELYGVCHDMGPYPGMVSPWYPKGSASHFLRTLGSDATLYVRMRLLTEVAAGLEYLHRFTPTVVHGDLKGANILISQNDEACLCDFGLSSVMSFDEEGIGSGSSGLSSNLAGSLRWMAPELMRPSDEGPCPAVTTWSDMYALGSVTFELLTGHVPYHKKSDVQVMLDVIKGVHPPRPSKEEIPVDLSDEHWTFIESCWRDVAQDRPPISLARPRLEQLYCAIDPPEQTRASGTSYGQMS